MKKKATTSRFGKRKQRKRFNITRRKIATTVHKYQRRVFRNVLTGNALGFSAGAYSFTLNDLPGVTDFTNLYDQYCLKGVRLEFYLRRNIGNSANTVTGERPRGFFVVDYDDSTAPSNALELREYSNCRVWSFDDAKPFVMYLKPKMLQEVYRTAVSSAYRPIRGQWLSTAYNNVPHWGVKYYIENFSNENVSIHVEAKYYFMCKNPK